MAPEFALRAKYSRRKSSTLDPGFSETVRYIQEPSTLSEDLSIPYLGCGSEYPKAEYARRRSFDPGISDADCRESSTLDGDRVLSVPRFLVDC